jgi:hypothetical protein
MSRLPSYSFSVFESYPGQSCSRWPQAMSFPLRPPLGSEFSVKQAVKTIPVITFLTFILPQIGNVSSRTLH